ncbi:MAG: hypothetical protein MOGMAGMI_01773 [Candidatus Omnitrophica bacterium]|nr:hypothetical protein [Candidatus Omnitrophota bacterium]
MSAVDIKTTLREYIRRNYLGAASRTDFGDDDSFLREGIVDSIGILELAQFVQETFGVRVETADILPSNFDTLNNLERYVDRKLKTAGGP